MRAGQLGWWIAGALVAAAGFGVVLAEAGDARTGDADLARLNVNSKPWSDAYVDGELVGQTPLRGVEVPSGVVTLTLVCGSCEPAVSHETQVVVPAGGTLDLVHGFDDGWTRTRSSPPTHSKAPTTPPRPPPMERVLVEEGEPEGQLLLNSKPWSYVSVDGEELGAVPLDVAVAPGDHTVTFTCGACDPARTRTETVHVTEGSSTKLILVLD